jgi:hypothetical protein
MAQMDVSDWGALLPKYHIPPDKRGWMNAVHQLAA